MKFHLKKSIFQSIRQLQSFADRIWYPYLLGLLAALDFFVVVIPTDGLIISSTLLRPQGWLRFALLTAIGSTLGSALLLWITNELGVPYLLDSFGGLTNNSFWIWSLNFFKEHGLIVVFLIAATPLAQQPAVLLASLAETPFKNFLFIYLLGRLCKYLFMSYVSSHAPSLISKMWGIQDEIHETQLIENHQNK
jgi:membrane protein YqaA with SNARE-associated domain